MDKCGQNALQVTKRDIFVHHEPLHLMKHGSMSQIRITSIYLSRRNDSHRGIGLLHHSGLGGRCVGPKQNIVRNIESILHIPGRMILGDIKSLEVVIICFNLGSFRNIKTQFQKYI